VGVAVRKNVLLYAIVIIISLACIANRIGADIWFDEGYSVAYAQTNYSYIMQPHDVHPPVYYMILRAWMSVAQDPMWLRMLSLIFGIGSLILFYKIVNKRFDADTATFATCIMALTTTFWYYSTEIRMYALLHFLGLSAFYALLKYEKNEWSIWSYLGISFVMLFVHYMAILYIGMMMLYILIVIRPPFWESIRIVCRQGVIAIPAIVYFLIQKTRVDGLWFKKPNFISVPSSLYFYFFKGDGEYTVGQTFIGLAILGVIIWLIWKYVAKVLRDKDSVKTNFIMFLVLMSILPMFLLWSINVTGILSGYHHRFFYVESWAAVLLVSLALYNLRRNVKEIALMIFAIFMVINVVWFVQGRQTVLQETSIVIQGNECLPVVHNSQATYVPDKYYIKNEACWTPYMYVDTTERQLNSAGGDVVLRSQTFKNPEELALQLGRFYYLLPYRDNRSGIERAEIFNMSKATLMYHTDGLDLYKMDYR
jgi:mannosyltransferase